MLYTSKICECTHGINVITACSFLSVWQQFCRFFFDADSIGASYLGTFFRDGTCLAARGRKQSNDVPNFRGCDAEIRPMTGRGGCGCRWRMDEIQKLPRRRFHCRCRQYTARHRSARRHRRDMEGRLEVRKELAAGLTRLYEDRRRVRNGNRSRTTSPTAGIDTERSGRHDPVVSCISLCIQNPTA